MSDWKNDIERYKRGELTAAQMHELEKKALFDPFLADALDGIENISSDELSEDIAELNKKIYKKRHSFFTPLRIAASVIVLIGIGAVIFWPDNQDSKLVQKEKQEVEPKLPVPDSIPEQKKDEPQQIVAQERQTKSKVPVVPKHAPPIRDTVLIAKVDSIEAAPSVAQHNQADEIPQSISLKTVRGKITADEDGLPMPGVTVRVKGQDLGTNTDIDGNYTINVPADASLVFSFIGMMTTELPIGDLTQLDLKMKEDATQLGEVVVVTAHGYTRPDTETPVIVLAEPIGGIKAYDKYMEDSRRYPQQALDANVKGRVVVEFNVGVNGSISNFVVMRSLGFGCDDEVIRLVKEGPAWRPTTENNKAVESNVRVRMKFDAVKEKARRK